MFGCLCEMGVFNTAGLACDLDSAFAEMISPLLELHSSTERWLHFGRHYWEEGAGVHTCHACHLCEGHTWTPLHSDFFLTQRCSKEESNNTNHHFPTHILLWHRGQLANGWWSCHESPNILPTGIPLCVSALHPFSRTKRLPTVPPRCRLPVAFCWQEGETPSLWGGLICF